MRKVDKGKRMCSSKETIASTLMTNESDQSEISQTLRGGRQSKGQGRQPIIWQHFCRKLHENERLRGRDPF